MKTKRVQTTVNLYRRLMGPLGLFVMVVFCKMAASQATEISPLVGFGQENYNFNITGIGQSKSDLSFEPNMVGIARLAVNAYGFGVGYSFRGSDKDLDARKGTTTFSDFQFGYHTKKWGLDTVYQSYKGFYTNGTQNLQLFPDLQAEHYALMGRWALNDSDFSLNALMDQSDEIKNSAGKYYLVGGFQQHRIENPISLLQQDYAGINSDLENLRKLNSTSANLGAGIGQYWVAGGFYFGALVDVIGTYGVYKYESTVGPTNSSYGTLSYNLKGGLGYAGKVFKTGAGLSFDVTTLKTPGASYIRSSVARVLIYLRLTF